MKALAGSLAVALALAAATSAAVCFALALARHDPAWGRRGRRFVVAILAGALAAAAVMEWALVTHDFSLRYVADNGSRATPLLYTVASLWGALQGSILLWALILGVHLTLLARRQRRRPGDPLSTWAMLVGSLVAVFFFGLLAGPANPFRPTVGTIPLDGRGPNPLLQNHPLMAVHPPMLYLGYVGFTVPFAYAVAALATGRVGDGWLSETRRTTLLAWGFLTAGIVLGAWWSYEVLGWGGYFAWDPVENASLLPWLTATAFLHSLVVQERRGLLRVWNLALILATFCLTILGTFLTRSGVVNSVHAFSQSAVGPMLLGFLALCAAVSLALIAWRADLLRGRGTIESPVSREGAFLANNLVFAALAFVVLLGTVFPLVAEAVGGGQLSVGEPYFDRMAAPLGLCLLSLMAVAPVLPWRRARGPVLQRRLERPAWAAVAVVVVIVAAGARGLAELAAFGLAAFALAVLVQHVVHAAATRRQVTRERRAVAAVRLVAGNRRFYGGMVVHVGVIVVAVALAASRGYATHREVRLEPGRSAIVRGYELTYAGPRLSVTPQRTRVSAVVRVHRDGRDLGTRAPALSVFPNASSAIGTPSVRTSAGGDLYLTLVSSPNDAGRVTLGVYVNPLVVWLWIGGGVMLAGTVLAAWPSRRRQRRPRPHPARPVATPAREEVPA